MAASLASSSPSPSQPPNKPSRPPSTLLPAKPFPSSQNLPGSRRFAPSPPREAMAARRDAAACTARLPAPSCPRGAGRRAPFLLLLLGERRADPVTFPLPELSQRKPGQGGVPAASPATYQGKLLCNPRDPQAGRQRCRRPGAASPEHDRVPAGLRGKGRERDLHARGEDKRDKVNGQTARCFPPALSALWDRQLRGAGASGT